MEDRTDGVEASRTGPDQSLQRRTPPPAGTRPGRSAAAVPPAARRRDGPPLECASAQAAATPGSATPRDPRLVLLHVRGQVGQRARVAQRCLQLVAEHALHSTRTGLSYASVQEADSLTGLGIRSRHGQTQSSEPARLRTMAAPLRRPGLVVVLAAPSGPGVVAGGPRQQSWWAGQSSERLRRRRSRHHRRSRGSRGRLAGAVGAAGGASWHRGPCQSSCSCCWSHRAHGAGLRRCGYRRLCRRGAC